MLLVRLPTSNGTFLADLFIFSGKFAELRVAEFPRDLSESSRIFHDESTENSHVNPKDFGDRTKVGGQTSGLVGVPSRSEEHDVTSDLGEGHRPHGSTGEPIADEEWKPHWLAHLDPRRANWTRARTLD